MKFENAFTVDAPVDEVWRTLLDVERVAPCMPGAEVTERIGDDAYKVSVKVKVGPMSMTYRGEVQIVDRDEQERRATMHVKAKEARGQGTADADVHMSLAEQAGGTHAAIKTEVQMSGRIAAMGQSVIGDVSAKLIETFAANLAAMLSDGGGPSHIAAAASAGAAPAGDPSVSSDTAAAPVDPSAGAPRPAAPPRSALPAGKIAAAVVAGRLANPRTLLTVTVVFGVVFLAIGFLIGRARGVKNS
jgi:carbon monoxide dehydrogenase subunit G